jgi:hypothetical protein
MATVTIRGRHIKVQAKEGRQVALVIDRLEARTNEQLDEMEAESFPNRKIVRGAIEKLDDAEQCLRSLFMDLYDAAEDAMEGDSDMVPDYIAEDGTKRLYPENVDPELDGIIHQIWEIGMNLREYFDEQV